MFPVVLSIRCDPKKTALIEGFKISNKLRKFFYKRANVIIAQTQYAKAILFEQFGHTNIITIPNFLNEFKDLKIERVNEIVCVGRLIKSKGHDYLIKAFSMVDNEDWKLIIVGDGPEKSNIEELTLSLGLSSKVLFVGNQKEVNAYYQRAKIFAFPSLTEGFPNVLIEAMACGTPVIAFNRGSVNEVVDEHITGYKVSDITEMENAVSKISFIDRTTCRNKALERFDVKSIAKQYLAKIN